MLRRRGRRWRTWGYCRWYAWRDVAAANVRGGTRQMCVVNGEWWVRPCGECVTAEDLMDWGNGDFSLWSLGFGHGFDGGEAFLYGGCTSSGEVASVNFPDLLRFGPGRANFGLEFKARPRFPFTQQNEARAWPEVQAQPGPCLGLLLRRKEGLFLPPVTFFALNPLLSRNQLTVLF